MEDNPGPRGKSEFMKRLTAGKTLCSEVNKASSNAKFLHLRRHKAFVAQLESAKQSMLEENDRAQKDMRRRLESYKRRKRSIFRERVLCQQTGSDEEDADRCMSRTTSLSSARGGGGKSSCYSISLLPSTAGGSNVGSLLPTILKVPIAASEDESIHAAIQRQLQQHMHRQESLHAQVLRSRVHDFCHNLRQGGDQHSFFVTSPTRRIAFRDTVTSPKMRQLSTALPGHLQTTLTSVA